MKWRVPTPDGKNIEFESPDGTTQEQALAYAQEHYTPEEKPFSALQHVKDEAGQIWGGAKALGRGVVEGVEGIAGLPGDVERGVGAGVKWAGHKLGLPDPPEGSDRYTLPSSEDIGKQREKVTGEFDTASETTPEKYLHSIGSFLPFVAQPEGAVLKKAASSVPGLATKPIAATSRDALATRVGGAVAGGVGSEAAGEAAEGTGYEGLARVAGGALGGAAAGKVEKSLADRGSKAALADSDKIKAASQAGYKVLEQNPTTIHPGAVNNFHMVMDTAFNQRWFSEVTAPATYRTMKDFERANRRWTIGDVMGQYERLGRIVPGGSISAQDAEAARLLRSEIIDWLDANAQGVKPQIKEALGNWSAHKKIEELQKAIEIALHRAHVSGTGANMQNTIRQEVRKIIDNDSRRRGYPPEVVAQLQKVADGTIAQNAARFVGRFAPTGLHSSAFTLALALHSAPYAAASAATGYAGKKLGDYLTHRGVEEAIVKLEEGAPTNANANARRQNVMDRVGGVPGQGAARGAVAAEQQQQERKPASMLTIHPSRDEALENAQP